MKELLALLCIFLFVYECKSCHSGWHYHSGSCFKVFGDRTTWTDARSRCHHYGGHLAEDHSHSTHSFLVGLIKNDPSYSSSSGLKHHKKIYYIGARDENLDYDWIWESSGKVVYPEMFGPSQPDRYQGHPQKCLAINLNQGWSDSSNWDDVTCDDYPYFMYVCEMKDSGHSGSQLVG